MKITKVLAALLAAAVICGGSASCSSGKKSKAPDKGTAAEPETEPTTAAVPGVDFDEAVEAASGDAYLAIVDANWDKQYLGGTDEKNPLCYKAGTVHINGNGDYKVSVTANSTAFQYLASGDPQGLLQGKRHRLCGSHHRRRREGPSKCHHHRQERKGGRQGRGAEKEELHQYRG